MAIVLNVLSLNDMSAWSLIEKSVEETKPKRGKLNM